MNLFFTRQGACSDRLCENKYPLCTKGMWSGMPDLKCIIIPTIASNVSFTLFLPVFSYYLNSFQAIT